MLFYVKQNHIFLFIKEHFEEGNFNLNVMYESFQYIHFGCL